MHALTSKNLNILYDRYDCLGDEPLYKSNVGKLNYIKREIVGEFLFGFFNLFSKDKKEAVLKIYAGQMLNADDIVADLFYFGFVFVTPSGKLIMPMEIKMVIEDFILR